MIPKKVKCELLKITNRSGHPNFHFEINGQVYFYGIRGIKANYTIDLVCTKKYQNVKAQCDNISSILPSEFLKGVVTQYVRVSQRELLAIFLI